MGIDEKSKKVYGALEEMIKYLDRKLDDAMVQIWIPGGSYAFENLPAPSAETFRFAYKVTDDFTTDNRFVEGTGVNYPAGTTVGVVNRGTEQNPVYMYDVSTGAIFVDDALSTSSKNPVQNKVITVSLNTKMVKGVDYVTAGQKAGTILGTKATVEGQDNTASGNYAHAGGTGTIAQRKSQTVVGEFNAADTGGQDGNSRGDYAFIVGNGTADNNRSNALAVNWEGDLEIEGDIVSGGILKVDGADYAENFVPSEECPFGRFVTLDGEKIRLAQPHDGYVLGVTSPHPAIMGDQECEGIPVGLLGKLWVEHDGTLNVNGYAIAGDNGIATAYIGVQLLDRPTPTLYRVMAIDGNMAKILFR